MTFMLILGGAAAIYMIWLLFRLAALALPVYAGAGAAVFLHQQDAGAAIILSAGFFTALAVHLLGGLVGALGSPVSRILVATVFALPAGFAGYHAVRALAGLAVEGAWLTALSVIGAFWTAAAAWRSVIGERAAETLSPPMTTDPGPT